MIVKYDSMQRDTQLSRTIPVVRNIGAEVDKDTVQYLEGSGGNANIQAKITAKGAVPDITSTKVKDKTYNMYQFSLGFMLNGRDLNTKPELRQRNIEWCTRNIRRLEDNMWMNGDTTLNLGGVVTAARANTNGKVVATGASGSDVNNTGSWDGLDATGLIDIHADILEAVYRIEDEFNGKLYLVGRKADLKPIRKLDDMRISYADEILDLFQANAVSDFLRYSLYTPSGYVYVVAQDMDSNENVISEDLLVDGDYPKQPGNNYYVELRQWSNPNVFHSNNGCVEINTA